MAQLVWGKPAFGGDSRCFFSNQDLCRLFLPLMVEQLLEFLVGLADSIMVASVGEAAVSGVSLVDFVMALLISLFAALATGGSVVAGQYMGRGDLRRASRAADQLVWFVGAAAIGVMGVVYLLKPFILDILFGQISADVRGHAEIYLTITALSIPFLGLYGAGAAMFRTMGNARLPMRVSLLMGLLNVAGNALALYVFHLGTAGVALSTLFARAVAALVILGMTFDAGLPLHLRKSLNHRFQWAMIRRIMAIGIPYGLENGLFYFGRLVVLGVVATFGTTAIAANAVAGTLVMFQVLPGMAMGLGMTVVIARCVGAGDYEQARYYNRKILALVYGAHVVINLAVLALLPLALRVYGLSAAATALTMEIVVWHGALAVLVWPLAYTLPVTFRAAGDARYPMYVGVLSMFICRVALAYVLGAYCGMGVFGTWLAMFIDWFVKAGLFIRRYFSRKWTAFRVV